MAGFGHTRLAGRVVKLGNAVLQHAASLLRQRLHRARQQHSQLPACRRSPASDQVGFDPAPLCSSRLCGCSGASFGTALPAAVVLGSESCASVSHPVVGKEDSLVQCTLPTGVGSGLAVRIVQSSGVVSSQAVTVTVKRNRYFDAALILLREAGVIHALRCRPICSDERHLPTVPASKFGL